jgi:Cupin/FG-GAP-like repeat
VFDDAGSTIGQSGTLSGVTFDGPLNLTANYASVQLANGTTVVSSSGSGPGTINVTGTGSSLIFDNAQTVSNETINLGNSSYYDSLYEYDTTGAGQVLTLASSVTINVAGLAIFYTGGSSGDGIVNKGLIDATTSAGLLQIESSAFTNSGTIDVSGGAMAAIDSTTFTTTASSLIEIGANSYLNIDPTNVWSNLGLITLASGASLLLQGSESTTGLGSISNSGGTVELSGGTLNNVGRTLNGSSLGLTLVGGTITGGAVGGLAFTSYGGTLSGVMLEWPLNLENFVAQGGKPSAVGSLTGTNTLSNATISGSGELDNDGTTTVSGLTIGGVTTFYDGGTMTENGGSVTLGDAVGNTADLNIASTGTWDIQNDSSIYRGTGTESTITNSGLLEKTGGTGTSVISPDVANNGTIFVSCGTPAQAGALDFVGAVTGAGTDTISSHSMLEFNTTVASSQTVSFNGVSGALYLTNPTSFAGLISGFTGSNCIQLPAGWSFSNFSENLSGTLGTLTVSNGSTTAALDFAGDFTAGNCTVEQLEGITYILPATPAAPHVNFNGDDILWQNANGQASVWDMSGNTLIGGGPVSPNPGPSWHAVGTGDFNDNGHSDILFQNTSSGQASIWEMNGNKLIGGGPVSPNPGPSWRAVGTGDFNDDGHSDILFQNTSSGQVSVWEMNADEWQYYLRGQARMTVFDHGPKATTTDFRAGDVGVVRKNLGHYVENTGKDVMQFVGVFRAPRYEEISLAQWFSHLPPELLMQHLNLTREDLEKFPKEGLGVVPA